jgi:uncharacterized membrane protein YsdA (DUF1294 family)
MRPRTIAALVSGAFLLALLVGSRSGVVPLPLLFAYVGMSGVSFVVLGSDKRRAASRHRRIPETALHGLELLCGWPGSLVAQWHFAHKTRKLGYQTVFWAIVLLHLAVLVLAWTGAGVGAGVGPREAHSERRWLRGVDSNPRYRLPRTPAWQAA